MLASGSAAAWPWNDSQSDFSFGDSVFSLADARMTGLAVRGFRGGGEMRYEGERA